MNKIAPLSTAMLLVAAAAAAQAGDLAVTVEHVQTGDGQVLVGLFDSASSFPKQTVRGQAVSAQQRDADGKLRVVFPGIAPGSYAVSAVHDLDGNGKLNTNAMGIPTEPYGFSGKPAGRMGPPQFGDAAIDVPAAGTNISIELR